VPLPKRENQRQLVWELEIPLWPAGDNAARRRRVLPGAACRNDRWRNGLVRRCGQARDVAAGLHDSCR